MAIPKLPIGAIHCEDPPCGRLGDLGENEAADGAERQGRAEEEVLEAAVAALVARAGGVLCREDGEIDGSMPKQAGQQEGEALDAGEIEMEGGRELIDKKVFEHLNFAQPSATQAFSFLFNSLPTRYGKDFLSCSVI